MSEVLTGAHQAGSRVIPFWRAVFEVARKEILVFSRSKRLFIMGGFYGIGFLGLSALMAFVVTSFTSEPGNLIPGVGAANVAIAMYLGFPLVGGAAFLQVLGIVFIFDSIVREYEDRSLFLLLAKPISREALVVGKFVASAFAVGAIFLGIGTIAYFVVMLMMGEFAGAEDFLRYYGALGVLLLGLLAFSAMALFFSAISRSTTMSVLLSLSMWLIVLEILANSGLIYAAASRDLTAEHWVVDLMQYLNPATSIGPAVKVLVGFDPADVGNAGQLLNGVKGIRLDLGWSLLSLAAFTAAFLGGTVLAVQRRNFE